MSLNHVREICLVLVLASFTGYAGAHHAIGSDFNADMYVSVEAVVKDFRFVNPHPYVTAEVTAADGRVQEWRLLLDDRWELVEDGFSAATLQPGDLLVVTGMPSRRQTEHLYVRSIERPADGFRYTEDEGETEASNN